MLSKMPVIMCTTIVLLVSWVYTYFTLSSPELTKYFNYIMLIPAPIAAVFLYFETKNFNSLLDPFKIPKAKVLGFSFIYPIIFILVCGLLAISFGFAEVDFELLSNGLKFQSLIGFFTAILFLIGEEYAWRGYLLPRLSSFWGPITGTAAVGLVWAIWHGPLVFGLAGIFETDVSPLILCLVQMTAVFMFSFPFAYCYFKSGSIFPPVVFHYMWNWLNPAILGNIYRNKPGIIAGDILTINGEGVAGVLLGSLFVLWFLKNHSKFEAHT